MNDFTSVLWRRLCTDFRVHAGWRLEDMEAKFRSDVARTLAEFPVEDRCPWCREPGFDPTGLRHHIMNGYCPGFQWGE